jgi:sugar phosphate isomerase/epimerase
MGLPTLPDKIDEGSCVWIAQMLAERGLSMAAISGTFNMVDPDAGRLEHNLRRLDALAAACRWLDTRIITLCTGSLDRHDMWKHHPHNARKSTWERLVETMRHAVKIADRHEVTLAFEPEVNNVVSSVMRARRLLDEVASPWLKVVIDPANLLRQGDMIRLTEILDEAIDWIGQDIALAHAKEPPLQDADKKALEKMVRHSIERKTQAVAGALIEFGADDAPGAILESLMRRPGKKLLEQPSFCFYYPYFMRLRRTNYRGAIVIHGLEEREVDFRAWLLRVTLRQILKEGSTDAGPPS